MNLLYFWTGGGTPWLGGSTAIVGVSAESGRFAGVWTGSVASVGADATPGDIWITRQKWVGSSGTIGAFAHTGVFSGIGRRHGTTGITLLGKSTSEIRVVRHRTAMMVGTGRTRSER